VVEANAAAALHEEIIAQDQVEYIAPTSMESFIRRPNAHITWSSEVGRVSGISVTALLVEQGQLQMRGVRINVSKSDDFYLAEEELSTFLRALDNVQTFLNVMKEHHEEHAAVEWDDTEPEPIFRHKPTSTMYHMELDSRGLFIGGSWFHEPGQLARVIARAVDELKLH
jgi:hypothetical protein